MGSSLLNSYSPRSWSTTSFESPYAWRFLTLSWCASCKPMSMALYSATLLVQGLVRDNARGMTWFLGENEYDSNPGHQSCTWNGSRCSVEVHLPNRGVDLDRVYFSRLI